MNLDKLMRGNPRISTPLNGSIDEVWHNVIKWRGLIIKVHRLQFLRHPKSRDHYWRSNDILFTPYPTHHVLSVGIFGVDREVRVELSNQGSLIKVAGEGWSISNKGNQPLRSKFLLISGSNSSSTTFLSAHIDLKMFSFS